MNGRVAKIITRFSTLTKESAKELKKQWYLLPTRDREKELRKMQETLDKQKYLVRRWK